MTDGIRVFDGAHLRATLFDGTSDRLWIGFTFRQAGRTGFGPAKRIAGVARAGFAQLHLTTARNDWFINEETAALEDALGSIARDFADVRALGYSMGGYAVLRFARALRIGHAMTISPQFSLAADVVPFERRYRAEAAQFNAAAGDLLRHGTPDLQGIVVVDPFRPVDLAHARLIATAFPGMALARLGFGGHPATRLLGRAGLSGLPHRVLMADTPRPAALTWHHRAARRNDAEYWQALSRKAAPRRTQLAEIAAIRAEALAALAPDHPGNGT